MQNCCIVVYVNLSSLGLLYKIAKCNEIEPIRHSPPSLHAVMIVNLLYAFQNDE